MSAPLIVTGAPRSGTTLLYTLFDGHPDINWLVSEGYLFERICTLGDDANLIVSAWTDDIDDLVDGLKSAELMPYLDDGYRQDAGTMSKLHVPIQWDEERFRAALSTARKPETIPQLWQVLVEAYLQALGLTPCRYACMKSPDFGASISASECMNDARVVVILRDPIYMLNSLKRSRDMRGEKRLTWPMLATTIASFKRLADRINAADPDRVMWLRYEDLVREPRVIMEGVARFLGVPFTPSLTEPTILGAPWPGHSSFAPTEGIERTPAEREVEALTEREIELARVELAQFYGQFYAPSGLKKAAG